MRNVHERLLSHPIAAVRPWIERAWSGTDDDVFPRDRIPTWRKSPEGARPFELTPGVTKMGHGPFVFRLRQWDGSTWRVDSVNGRGWHGFDLEPRGAQTLIRHTLETEAGRARAAILVPIHDWAVESLFDRLEEALATGRVPAMTRRPMSWRAALIFRGLSAIPGAPRRLAA